MYWQSQQNCQLFYQKCPAVKDVIKKSIPDQRLEGLAINGHFSRSTIKWQRRQLVSYFPQQHQVFVWRIFHWTWKNLLWVWAAKVPINHLWELVNYAYSDLRITANIVNPFCLRDVCVEGAHIQSGVFPIKGMKSVVPFRYGSCFCMIGCNRESIRFQYFFKLRRI